MTHPARDELHVNVARPEIAQADVVTNDELLVESGENGGFHVRVLQGLVGSGSIERIHPFVGTRFPSSTR